MNVRWTVSAEADRIAIFAFTAKDSIFAADALDMLFEEGVDTLAELGAGSTLGARLETRELVVHPKYKLIYDRLGEDVTILAIVDVHREWPN
jgi:toxin ParE1/3/4